MHWESSQPDANRITLSQVAPLKICAQGQKLASPFLSAPWLATAFIFFQGLITTAFSQQVETRFNSGGFFRGVGWGEVYTYSRTFSFLSVGIALFYALKLCIFNYRYLVEEIKKREGFQLLLEVSKNSCYWALVCLLFGFCFDCVDSFQSVASSCLKFVSWRYTGVTEHA